MYLHRLVNSGLGSESVYVCETMQNSVGRCWTSSVLPFLSAMWEPFFFFFFFCLLALKVGFPEVVVDPKSKSSAYLSGFLHHF